MKNKIFYVASLGGIGSVNTIHIQSRAKLFSKLGYEVSVISDCTYDKVICHYNEYLSYYYLRPYKGHGKLRGFYWWKEQFVGIDTFKQIKKIVLKQNPNYVILYEPNSSIMIYLLRKMCRKHNVKLIIEVSEWMESKDHRIPDSLLIMQKDFQHRYFDKKIGNVIAISDFLVQHYKNQNCNAICLPPLFDIAMKEKDVIRYKHPRCNSSLRFVFAGSLGKKDCLLPLIQAILEINKEGIKVAFDVIGPAKEKITNAIGICNLEEYGIFLYGRLSHQQTLSIVKEADFSILLRENKRYAKAGVSTKFAEAMSIGVPSICTKVGGTDLFIKDRINGFLVDENDINALIDKISFILNMKTEEILEIKKNALNTAKKIFSIETYNIEIKQFFNLYISSK